MNGACRATWLLPRRVLRCHPQLGMLYFLAWKTRCCQELPSPGQAGFAETESLAGHALDNRGRHRTAGTWHTPLLGNASAGDAGRGILHRFAASGIVLGTSTDGPASFQRRMRRPAEALMTSNPPLIAVSVVSHGDALPLRSLMESLRAHEDPGKIQLIVTDNLGRDLPRLDPDGWNSLQVLRNQVPQGYGRNHNAAFGAAQAEYFCVLNPDVVFLTSTFGPLLAALEFRWRRHRGSPGRGSPRQSSRLVSKPPVAPGAVSARWRRQADRDWASRWRLPSS